MVIPTTAFIAPGGGELLLVLLVLILLFGAKDAPRILRTIQRNLDKVQRSAADFRYKLMYGDLHSSGIEESKDTSVYDAVESDDDSDHALKAEDPSSENEPEKHEKPAE
jgi:Sec-independent protein translocase protein TatA